VLFDVRYCFEMRKDGNANAALLHEFGVQMMGGKEKAENFAGWCIDNTRDNMSAVRELEILQPEWINYGCAAHCGHLGMKDFSKYEKTLGRFSTSWGCEWLRDVVTASNTIANYIQDSGSAKHVLHLHQREIYGSTKCLPVNVPTCFGTSFFVMEGVHRSKGAIVQAVSSSAWDELTGKAGQVSFATTQYKGSPFNNVLPACMQPGTYTRYPAYSDASETAGFSSLYQMYK
jgi:hypothetical protein